MTDVSIHIKEDCENSDFLVIYFDIMGNLRDAY